MSSGKRPSVIVHTSSSTKLQPILLHRADDKERSRSDSREKKKQDHHSPSSLSAVSYSSHSIVSPSPSLKVPSKTCPPIPTPTQQPQDLLPHTKKKRRRRLSEILRFEGIRVGERSEEDDIEAVDFKSKDYTWYTTPGIKGMDSSIHSRCVSENSSSVLSSPNPSEAMCRYNSAGSVRFKRVVSMIKNQLLLVRGLQKPVLRSYLSPGGLGDQKEILTFNINAFHPDVVCHENLSMRAKSILSQPSWLRSEEDVQYVSRYTIRLKCLKKYPEDIRSELARVLHYEKFEKGRVVIRQGDIGVYFYFILNGSVLIEIDDVDRSGKDISMIVGEMKAGAAFGEMALLQGGVRRGATIICFEDTEFLKVDKPDFDEVQRKSRERKWHNRMQILKKHLFFRSWNNEDMCNAAEWSRCIDYEPRTLIVRDLSVPLESIYLITKGSCLVVKKVKLWEKVQNYQDESYMLPVQNLSNPSRRFSPLRKNYKLVGCNLYRLVKKWWVLRKLKEGDYFGLGEGEPGMHVVSDQKASVIMVDKTAFRKHDRGRDLARLRVEAICWYPSDEAALKSYIWWKQWHQYKRIVGNEALGKRQFRETTEHYMLAE